MADITGKTHIIKLDIDDSLARSKLQSFRAEFSKGITSNINITGQATATGVPDFQAKKQSAQAQLSSQAATSEKRIQADLAGEIKGLTSEIRQTRRGRTPGGQGGDGGGGGIPPRSGGGGAFGSDARGDRSGGLLSRARSVAEFTVAATLVRGGFSAFSKGVSAIAEVQNQIQELNKVLNTSRENLDDLKKSAIDTAKEFGLSTTQVLKGFKVFAQQGLPADEVKKLGKTVALASNVSSFGTEDLAEIISTAKKLLPVSATGESGQKLIDSFLAVEGKNAVSENDLADVFKRIGPQAFAAGISVDQLNALTTVMKENTRAPSGEIATSLRFIIKNLQSDKTIKALQKEFNGIEGASSIRFTNNNGDLRNTFDILQDISKVYPTLTKRQQTFIAQQIGETRFASKFIGLINGFDKAGSVVEQSQNAQGEAFQRNQIIMQSLQKQVGKTGAAFEGFAISFGSNFTGPAMTFLKVLEKSFDILTKMSDFEIPGLSAISKGFQGLTGTASTEQTGVSVGQVAAIAAIPVALLGIKKAIGFTSTLSQAASNIVTKAATGGTVAAGTAAAAEGTAIGSIARAGTGVAGRSLVGAGLEFISGSALGSVLGKTLPAVIKGNLSAFGTIFSPLINGIGKTLAKFGIGRAIGTGLGAFGGVPGALIGNIIGGVLIDSLIKVITRSFEGSRDRVERKGLVTERERASSGIDFANNLQTSAKNIETINKNIELAKKEPNQEAAKKEGKIDKTEIELTKDRDKERQKIKQFLADNEEVLKKTKGVEITSTGDVILNGKNVEKNSDALNSLISTVRSTQARNKSVADTAISLDSLSERIESETKDQKSEASKFLAAQRKAATGKPIDLSERLLLDRERSTGGEISAKLIGQDLDNLGRQFELGGAEGVKEALKQTDTKSKNDLFNILNPKKGIREGVGFIPNFSPDEALIGELSKRFFDDLKKDVTGQDIKKLVDIPAGGLTEGLKKTTTGLSEAGDIITFVNKQNRAVRGKVFQNADGEKFVSTFENLGDTAKQATVPLKDLFNNVAGSLKVFRPSQVLQDLQKSFDKDISTVGFGAGQFLNAKGVETGPSSLLDLSDQIAGSFQGFNKGVPQFNSGLQKILAFGQEQQEAFKKTLSQQEEGTIAQPIGRERQNQLTSIESSGILAKAVESFGRIVKAFESSVQKFQQFQNRQAVAEKIGISRQGPFAGLGATPEVQLTKDLKDLTATDKAKLALPQSFKALSELQFQFQQLRDVGGVAKDEESNLTRIVTSASTEALSSFNVDVLKKAFQGNQELLPGGATSPEVERAFNELIKPPSESSPKDRQGAIDKLLDVFKGITGEKVNKVFASSDQGDARAKEIELSIKTATALSQLQISAEEAGRSLSNLQKFGSLFQNVNRAKGEGPFGVLGAQAPVAFTLNKGETADQARQIDFSKENQFEQQRELVRRLSSEEVRRGQTQVLDENRQAIAPLNETQRASRLKDIDIQEQKARRSQVEQTQRAVLNQQQQNASGLITSIQNVIDTQSLNPKAKAGLKDLQGQLISISNLPEKSFLDQKGNINTKIFGNALESVPKQLKALLPADLAGASAINPDLLKNLVSSGALTAEEATKVKQTQAAQESSPITNILDKHTPLLESIKENTATSAGKNSGASDTALGTGIKNPEIFAGKLPIENSPLFNNKLGIEDTIKASTTAPIVSELPSLPAVHTEAMTALKENILASQAIPPATNALDNIRSLNDYRTIGLANLNLPSALPPEQNIPQVQGKETFDSRKVFGTSVFGENTGENKESIISPKLQREGFLNIDTSILDRNTAGANKKALQTPNLNDIKNNVQNSIEKKQESGADKAGQAVNEGVDKLGSTLKDVSSNIGDTIKSAMKDGSGYVADAMKNGSSSLEAILQQLADSMNKNQGTTSNKGTGAQSSTMEDKLDSFLADQADRFTRQSASIEDLNKKFDELSSIKDDLENIRSDKVDTQDFEAIKTSLNQIESRIGATEDSIRLNQGNMTDQILDLKNEMNILEGKINTYMKASTFFSS